VRREKKNPPSTGLGKTIKTTPYGAGIKIMTTLKQA